MSLIVHEIRNLVVDAAIVAVRCDARSRPRALRLLASAVRAMELAAGKSLDEVIAETPLEAVVEKRDLCSLCRAPMQPAIKGVDGIWSCPQCVR